MYMIIKLDGIKHANTVHKMFDLLPNGTVFCVEHKITRKVNAKNVD